MKPIIVNDNQFAVRIVHGVVIKGLTGWVGFESLKALPKGTRNLINCGSPNPSKGKKDLSIYSIVMRQGEPVTTLANEPVEQQWRRGTLAVTTHGDSVYAALTVYNPDDRNKHDFMKRAGRWGAYRTLKRLLIDVTWGEAELFLQVDENHNILKAERIRNSWVFDKDNTSYYIRLPECNFAPKLDWAIEMQRWVKLMMDREAYMGETNQEKLEEMKLDRKAKQGKSE